MTFIPIMQTSIHGRRVGLSSTGALLLQDQGSTVWVASVTKSSADVVQGSTALLFAQSGVNPQTARSSTVGSTFTNYGFELLSSGSATAISFEISAPVAGVTKEILIDTSASEATFGSCTTAIVFGSTVANAAGSTMFFSRGNLAGTVIVLRGISATQWAVIGSTTSLVIG